jgi:hypothetical protein
MSRNRKEMSRQEEEEEGGPGETFPSIAPKRRFCHFFSGGSPNLLAHDAARRGPVVGGVDGVAGKSMLARAPRLAPGQACSMVVAGAGRLGGSISQ